jgi:hypothetical protein
MSRNFILLTIVIMSLACNDQNDQKAGQEKDEQGTSSTGTFGFDLQFLSRIDSGLVQLQQGSSSVLVSPKFQAKVFTSTAAGEEGKSFGWINYKAFTADADPHMNAYGGENRFWLGPEGGKFSLYFKKGDSMFSLYFKKDDSMVFDNWKTPAPIDTESWEVVKKDDQSVTMRKDMQVANYTGAVLSISVLRTVNMQTKEEIEKDLSVDLENSVRFVGYSTENIIRNTGNEQWSEKTGMPCIWILDMFNPSDSTTIVIPYKPATAGEKVATTGYFGEIDKDRIRYDNNILFFKADGKKRGKLGIVPQHAMPVAGSYDAQNNVLTITSFTIDNNAKYLNQEWNTTKPVFSGDAMNAYNDGPLTDGSQMGPFYEIESVSPAAALQPGATLEHRHNVYHFTGDKEQLNNIASKVLRVSLSTIKQTFK